MEKYNHIVGPDQVNNNVTHAYIFTIPKSGSVFISIFMNVYSELLNTKYPSDKELQYSYPKIGLFGKTEFVIEHAECPGYMEAEKDPKMLALWKSLAYSDPGWAGNEVRKKRLSLVMAPAANKNNGGGDKKFLNRCKIVFIYRNFLDQMISFFKHQRSYLPDNHPSNQNLNISRSELENFIFEKGALASCIKFFYSYYVVSKKHPDMILFVPYEEIINNKETALRRIINHLGLPYNEKCFLKAIELTSIENMKDLENRLGHSLMANQQVPYKNHIRNGSIGAWQAQMTPETVKRIENIMNQFGLSLNMFYLSNELEPKFSFLNLDNTPKPRPRI